MGNPDGNAGREINTILPKRAHMLMRLTFAVAHRRACRPDLCHLATVAECQGGGRCSRPNKGLWGVQTARLLPARLLVVRAVLDRNRLSLVSGRRFPQPDFGPGWRTWLPVIRPSADYT